MFTRMPNTCVSPVCLLIALAILATSAEGQLTKKDPYYSLTQSYLNLEHQALNGTFTQSNASVLAFVTEDDETANSIGLSAVGDWTYRVPRQAGFGKVTFSAFLPFSVGNHPVEGFSFTRLLDSRWINGGGSDADHLAMTVGSSNLYLYELVAAENPDNPASMIGPEVLAVIDRDPVSVLAGNGFDTVVDDTIRRVDSYTFAANTDYVMELRVTTDIINHSFLPTYPTRLVTSEFGGNLSRGSGYGYGASFLWRPLPEPGTWILGMAAVLCGTSVRRRRRMVVPELAQCAVSGLAGAPLLPRSDLRRRHTAANARCAGTLLLAVVTVFDLTGRSHAATFGTGKTFVGRWDNPSNWKDSIIPDATKDATIRQLATAQVTGGVAYAGTIYFEDGAKVDISDLFGPGQLFANNVFTGPIRAQVKNGEVSVSGQGSLLAISDDPARGGMPRDAEALNINTLKVQRGGMVSGDELKFDGGTVDGAGSQLIGNRVTVGVGGLKIQNGGAVSTSSFIRGGLITVNGVGASLATISLEGADVNVENGATLFSHNAWGSAVSVKGPGSHWTNLEIFNGSLNISDGGWVTSNKAYITGTAQLTGVDSRWISSDALSVSGTLRVSHGSVTNTLGTISGSDDKVASVVVDQNGYWSNDGDLIVGMHGPGTLTIHNDVFTRTHGAVASTRGIIGDFAESTGTVRVTGLDSYWGVDGEMRVGNLGTGTLQLADAGLVTNSVGTIAMGAGSTGTALVETGAHWSNDGELFVGQRGNGTLNIKSGGKVTNHRAFVGDFPDSTGKATVAGAGSRWIVNGELRVGNSGTGSLRISSGGTVEDPAASIGHNPDGLGEAIVEGIQSTWKVDSNLYVGREGRGALSIVGGGQVTNVTAFVGDFAGANGTVTVSDPTSKWITSDIRVGNQGIGRLSILNGGTVSNTSSYLGRLAGSDGTATIEGDSAKWITNSLLVGEMGSGQMHIRDGGEIESFGGGVGHALGSIGVVTVDGTSSKWINRGGGLDIAAEGAGTLNIKGGGLVSGGFANIGLSAGSNGLATVIGFNSRWITPTGLTVGRAGRGELTVQDGGQVTSSNAVIGHVAGSDGQVTLGGLGTGAVTSNWKIAGDLYVGYQGHGEMTLNSYGQVASGRGLIGDFGTASGKVTVGGLLTKWDSGTELRVGNQGTGELIVTDGASVAAGTAYVGYSGVVPGNYGKVTVDGFGSGLDVAGALHVGVGGTGTLTVKNRGTVTAGGGVTIGPKGSLLGNGEIDGDVTNLGEVAPGLSPGKLTIDGDYVQSPTGMLRLEIGGNDPNSFDQLVVNGNASLRGEIVLDVLPGFLPQAGDHFVLMNVDGMFANAADLSFTGVADGWLFSHSFDSVGGRYIVTSLNDARAVPEPISMAILASGVSLMLLQRRDRKRASRPYVHSLLAGRTRNPK